MLPQYEPSGTGWRFPWDGNWRVEAGSLQYSSGDRVVASRGNKVRGTSAESQRIMELAAPLGAPGTRVWVTMLGKQTAGTASNTFAGLRLPTGQSTFVYMGKPYGLPNWGLDGGPGTVKLQSAVPATEESLLVMRIDFRAGADDVYLWVNPPLNAEPTPATASIAAPGYNDFNNITKVLMEMGSVGSSIEAEFDEVRVGRTWQDAVMMVPPPVLCVTPRSVGGCCYEFDLGQETGASGFPGVVMTLPSGTTVSSATIGTMPAGSTVTYTPGGTTVRWDLPSGTGMNSSNVCLFNFTVTACFSGVASGVTTAVFDAVGGSYLGPQNHVLTGPSCPTLSVACCDRWRPTGFGGQPGAPVDSAMVYDEGNQVTVLWGGEDCNLNLQGTVWVRRDAVWSAVTAIAGNGNGVPAARSGHAMAYDPVRKVIVMYGGRLGTFGSASFDDLWELRFNGTNWVWDLRAAHGAPGVLSDHAMAFDPISREIMIMGGQDFFGFVSGACWAWRGQFAGSFVSRATMIRPVQSFAAATDESRQTIVSLSDQGLQEYQNGVWTIPGVFTPPSLYRDRSAMAYDSACGRMVIFGGHDFLSNNALGDMWSYDGTTVSTMSPTTAPSVRMDHCMSWDKRLQRVVLYGGVAPQAGCTDNTWRFDSGNQLVRRQGWVDGFSAVTVEPAPGLAPAFLAARPLLAMAAFDQTANNKTFGTSFSIPAWARGKITKAVLEFRARPVAGDAANDTFGISDFTTTGGGLWSTSFESLPASGGNWNAGHGATTFLLDLSALPVYSAGVLQPGTTDLVHGAAYNLNMPGAFPDLFVQDDTAVDYARLHLWTCPPPPWWVGFDVYELGAASASVNAQGQLAVSGMGGGGGGGNGVQFNFGAADGADLHWSTSPFASSPVGSSVVITASGVVDGVPDSMVSRLTATKTSANQAAFTCDAGRPTNRVELYNGQALVASVSGVPSGQACFMIGNNWHTDWHCNDPSHILFVWSSVTFNDPEQALLQGTLYPFVTEVRFTPEGPAPAVEGVQYAAFTASGVGEVVFDDAAVRALGVEARGVGEASVSAGQGSITVGSDIDDKTGSGTSKGGVKLTFPAGPYVEAGFTPVAWSGVSGGSPVLLSVAVSGGDLPPGTAPAVSYFADVGVPPDGQGAWVAQEFTVPPGLTCVAYNDGVVVGVLTPAQAAAIRVDALPERAGWRSAPSGGHGLSTGFAAGTRLHTPGTGIIDITSLVWDMGPGGPEAVDGLTLEVGASSGEFVVTSVAQTAPCPADFNRDGFVDFFDYDGFVGAFEVGDPAADFNQDGFLDFFDYDGFVQAFEVGC